MRKYLICLLIFSGCVTEKQRLKICQSCPIVSVSKDSVYEHLVHDTIALEPIRTFIALPSPCADLCDSLGRLKPYYHSEHHGAITTTISSHNDTLLIECKTDSLKAYSDHLEKEVFSLKHDTKILQPVCEKKHKTSFDGFTFWWFWITIVIIIIYFLIKYLKSRMRI